MVEQLALPGTVPAPGSARETIAELRAAGLCSPTIAATLEARGIPTQSGRGRWWPSTVERLERPDAWAAYQRAYRARLARARTEQ